ncbi:TlpA disulfide reductase family protein [Chitinophaga sp. CF418]|uniref:TlpA family protein disulfide reductase n=1 Tax=Chitinophaga sp. CF418 TaxID=1855287 RepID=UPI00165FA081|nr:TlpA disulfide reductase family protein [Chitinophaga sp. CF418]
MKFKIKTTTLFVLTALLLSNQSYAQTTRSKLKETQTASITIAFPKDSGYDSLQVEFWKEYLSHGEKLVLTKSGSLSPGQNAVINISEINKTGYFIIQAFKGKGDYDYFSYFPLNPGDHASIQVKDHKLLFSGKGSEKMNIVYELALLKQNLDESYKPRLSKQGEYRYPSETLKWTYNYLNQPLDSLLNLKLQHLEKKRQGITLQEYNTLKANIITLDYFNRFNKFGKSLHLSASPKQDSLVAAPFFKDLYNTYLKNLSFPELPQEIITYCPYYSDYVSSRIILEKKLDTSVPNERLQFFLSKVKALAPQLRDKILTENLLYRLYRTPDGIDSTFYAQATQTITTPKYLKLLVAQRNNVTTGKPAYDFTLEDTQGKLVKLSDFKNKVVFLDFWFTGCFGCNSYYENTLSKIEEHYKGSQDIVIISVCIDKDKKNWLTSVAQNRYASPDGINLYTQGKGSSHELIQHYNIMGYPTLIIIDKEVTIRNINGDVKKWSVEKTIGYLDGLIKKRNLGQR